MRRTLLVAGLLLAAATLGAEEYFVPMVGQSRGADGAWWNTEVWVSNTAAATGGWAAVFLPAGQINTDGLRAEPELQDIARGATVYRNDLVPEGKIGTLRFITTAGVIVFVRVFNAAGSGSFGQAMVPLTRAAATRPGETAHLIGLRRTPQFRTNIGLFNPSFDVGVVRVRILDARGAEVGDETFRLVPGGYIQLNDGLHAFGVARGEHLRAEVTGTIPFFAFASVIDSRSGAPTLVPAQR
jgi:hypothetical protein